MSLASENDQIKTQLQQQQEAASSDGKAAAMDTSDKQPSATTSAAATFTQAHSGHAVAAAAADKPSDKDGDASEGKKDSGASSRQERKTKPGGRAMRELTREECDKMLNDGFTGRNAQRDRAYFATGLYLGLRVEELLAIKREDMYDYGAKKFREILYLSKQFMKGSAHSLRKKARAAAVAAAKKRKAREAPETQPAAKRAIGAATTGANGPAGQDPESDEVKALKQRIAQLEQRQAELETPKTPLERMLVRENEQFKAKLAEEEANREQRRRKVPPARIPIPARLHPFLEGLCVGEEPSGPLFVSERLALGGEEKAPDSDTMLKTLKRAAKRAGLHDWEHVGNHSMKHTFTRAGARLLGGDLAKLKKMTRHKSLSALVEYLKPGEHEIKLAFDGLDMLSSPAQPVITSSAAGHSSSPSAASGSSGGHLPSVSLSLTPKRFATTHSAHTPPAAAPAPMPAPDADADADAVTVTVTIPDAMAVSVTTHAADAVPFQQVPRYQQDGDVEMQPDAADGAI